MSNENIELQIKLLNNKIERLVLQRDFYKNLLELEQGEDNPQE